MRRVGALLGAVLVMLGACGSGDTDLKATDSRTDDDTAETTTSTTELTTESTTSTVLSATTLVPPVTGSRVTPATTTTTTTPPRPLEMTNAIVGVGPPCKGGNPDGCYWFVIFPDSQRDLPLWLHSDKGYSAGPLDGGPHECDPGQPGMTGPNQCALYMGAVYDRAANERECWWFTTTAPGWQPKSNTFCFQWKPRATTTTS